MFQALVVAATVLACLELTRMLEKTGRAVHARLAIGVGAALTASFATSLYAIAGVDGRTVRWMPTPELVLVLGVGLMLSAPLWTAARPSVEATANTLCTAVYVGWLLGYAIWLQGRADGPLLVIFLVGVTWIGETAAYLVGSSIGRHPLAPALSPKKTLEGAAAQVVASIAAALVLGAWLIPACSLAGAAGAGVLLGVIGQVGDLAESAIKRSLGTKDAGELIPGHGGMLDRIDGLLFNAPALYFYSLYAWCRP
jgi:phosphatidate cytidylyltransferase